MKLQILTFIIALVVFNPAGATTFRQSSGVDNFTLNLSYENIEFDNDMKHTNGSISAADFNRDFNAPIDRDLIVLRGSYGLLKQMDVFAGIGYVDEEWTGEKKEGGTGSNYKQTGKNAIFELGIKGTVFELMNNDLYFAYLAKYRHLQSGEDFSGPSEPTSSSAIWNELVFDFEVGYRLKEYNFTPYAGVSYLDIRGKQNLIDYVGFDNYNSDFENSNKIGAFIGFNYEINEIMSANIEAVFGAVQGLSAGIQYAF